MATNGTKVPALKNVPATTDRELKATLESMKEAQEIRLGRRGDPRDRAITLRELIESGLAKQLRENPFDPNAGAGAIDFTANTPLGDLTVPPAPTGLEASGAFTAIILNWNGMSASAPYGNHAYTEIWRSRDNNLAGATLRATTTAFIYTDEVGYGETYYYWVRYVSTSNVPGPYNDTNGVEASTVENIAKVMQQLSEELQDLPGYQTLNSDLSDISQDIQAEAAAASRVIKTTSAPTTRSDGSSLQPGDIWIDTDDNNQMYVRNASNNGWTKARDSSLISLYNSLNSTVGTNSTNIANAQGDIITLTTDTSANATAITNLQASLTTTNSNVTVNSNAISSLTTQIQSNDGDITSLSASITSLSNTVNTINGDYATGTALTALTSRVSTNEGSITSINSSITSLQSQITANDGDISGNATAISGLDTRVTSAEGNITSQANSITQLQTDVGNTSASVTTLQTSVASLEGDAQAAYVLQVQANGSVAGMVIEANASGATTGTAVQFVSDKFAIWNGTSGTAPFIVSSGTVYIKNAMIQDAAITNAKILDGTIQTAKIGDAQITNAKIGDLQVTTGKIALANITTALIGDAQITNAKINDLSADKINAGTISADRIGANTITADKINVTDLALDFTTDTVTGTAIGGFLSNTMRLKKVADLGTEAGIYHIFCRVFGGTGQVKTLSVVAGDGTFGTFGNELRSDFTYSDALFATNLPIANQGYAQFNSGQAQTWSGVDRFDSTYKMVQKDFIVRKTSSTSRTLALYILAQGDGGTRYLSNVQYGFYKFSEI